MTGKEKKVIKQRVLAKDKLRQFYSSYKYYIDESIKFVDVDMRQKLTEIEDFFTIGKEFSSPNAKKKAFHIPFNKYSFDQIKKISNSSNYMFNKELKEGVKRIKAIHERQSFRNICIFKMMKGQLEHYLYAFKNNYHIKGLCKISGEIGNRSKKFRFQRIKEAKDLIMECNDLIRLSRNDIFINNIDEYMRVFADFFVQCQFRLDKFHEGTNILLSEQKDVDYKDADIKSQKSENISLELPG